jgi:hypothetical protein
MTTSNPLPDPSNPNASARRAVSPSSGPLVPRLINALLLRRAFYDAVAADSHATGPAGAMVCIAAIARESVGLYQLSQSSKAWGFILVLIVVFAVVRWLVYASIMYPIARLLGAPGTEYRRLLRCLGFAETPALVSVLGFAAGEPFAAWVQFAVGAWLLAATIVAVRSAVRVSTARAAVIGTLGFAAYLGLGLLLDLATRLPASAPAAPQHLDPAPTAMKQSAAIG